MTIAAGTHLGAFEIIGRLGAGGMGEVWRARDTKLGREVAIKTLPGAFAGDPDRLARFEREAQLLAALNHAHIGAIYGLDEHDGALYLAMELVEGETLEEKLKVGPLPVDEALRFALQIAEALEAAHAKGVVHRDLKPANIMITPEGSVKVLDFGLAKAFTGNPSEASPAHSPALSVAMTQAGLVLGTAGYMSPEQASGQATDQRADVWAFGVVVYEMLTGLPLFSGESVPHILAAVLQKDPDWSRLPTNLNPRLKLMLERCLTKKPRERYHAIADARVDIEKVLADPAGLIVAPAAAGVAARPRSLLPWAAVTVILAGLAGAGAWLGKPAAPLPVSRSIYTLPDGFSLIPRVGNDMAFSDDGRYIALAGTGGIHLRAMDEFTGRTIPGTENCGVTCADPVFSPDGQWLVYRNNAVSVLERIPVVGGASVRLAPGFAGRGGLSWDRDDSIVFGTGTSIARISPNGGEPEQLVAAGDLGQIGFPQLLDNGAVLFMTSTLQIFVQPPGGNEPARPLFPGALPRYVDTGHIIYWSDDALFAVPFDADALTVTGGPVPVAQEVAARYAASKSGSLAYVPGSSDQREPNNVVALVDREGQQRPLPLVPRPYGNPRISPDGMRLAVDSRSVENGFDVWVYELDGQSQMRQLAADGNNSRPMWTPDGEQLTYTSDRDGSVRIYLQAADLSGTATPLTPAGFSDATLVPESWTPDGRTLAFSLMGASPRSLWTVSLDENGEPGEPQRFVGGVGDDDAFTGAFSPDGNWLAYMRVLGPGNEQLFLEPFPPNGTRFQLTQTSGSNPLWSPDGTELFYRYGQQMLLGTGGRSTPQPPTLYSIGITLAASPRFSTERALPIERFSRNGREYDITPDGRQFVLVFPEDAVGETGLPRNEIYIVENWLEELR